MGRLLRLSAELQAHGWEVNHKRVDRIVREAGNVGVHLRKKVKVQTTVPDPDAAAVPDLIQRDFTAEAPNTKYVGDIAYLPIRGGQFLHLATVLDLCSCRLTGWAIADHMRTELITQALENAARPCGGRLDGATTDTSTTASVWDSIPEHAR